MMLSTIVDAWSASRAHSKNFRSREVADVIMRCSNFFFQVMLPPCDATTAGVQLGSREELFDPKLLIPATSLNGGRFGSRHPWSVGDREQFCHNLTAMAKAKHKGSATDWGLSSYEDVLALWPYVRLKCERSKLLVALNRCYFRHLTSTLPYTCFLLAWQ